MSDAPERIWAFYAPDDADQNDGATIVAHESCQHGAQAYVRADLAPDAAYVGALREALEQIRDRHIPDQPAAYGGDELAWVTRQHTDLRRIAIAALAAKPQAAPVRVVVKPLEWRKSSVACEIADTPWGSVAVQDESHALAPRRWGWWMVGSGEDDSPSGYGIDIDAAKAAAQADYERRILSALAGQP